jgi:hypothetical protein
MVSYSLQQISTIQSNGFEYKLPEDVLYIINKLSDEIELISPSITITTSTTTINDNPENSSRYTDRNYKKRSRFNTMDQKIQRKFTSNIDMVWEKQKAFIATKIEKKEGIEKLINDIRICLNKISGKNYDSQKELIFQHIDQIIEKNNAINELASEVYNENNEEETNKSTEENEELNKIALSIFDTASTNKFYSELYANLYEELVIKYPIFKTIISSMLANYLEGVKNIQFVDSNLDYDKYCLNNKENDKRKATTVFIVGLMKKNIFSKKEVLDTILELQKMVLGFIDVEDKQVQVEEMTENLFLFFTSSEKEFIETENWKIVFDNIKTCSQLKVKEHKSISSRSIFKYKDIMDYWKKNNIV